MWLLLCFSLTAVAIEEKLLLQPEFLMRFAINQFTAQVYALTFGYLETWATLHSRGHNYTQGEMTNFPND